MALLDGTVVMTRPRDKDKLDLSDSSQYTVSNIHNRDKIVD